MKNVIEINLSYLLKDYGNEKNDIKTIEDIVKENYFIKIYSIIDENIRNALNDYKKNNNMNLIYNIETNSLNCLNLENRIKGRNHRILILEDFEIFLDVSRNVKEKELKQHIVNILNERNKIKR